MWSVLVLLLAANVVHALLGPSAAHLPIQQAVVPTQLASQLRLQLRSTAENASILPVTFSPDDQSVVNLTSAFPSLTVFGVGTGRTTWL